MTEHMDSCEIPRWQVLKAELNNLSFDDFVQKSADDPKAICMDARTKEEYEQGHLPNAININYLSSDLADQLELLDANRHYYIYCRTSRRSLRISVILKNMGFEHVFHLKDGVHDHFDQLNNK